MVILSHQMFSTNLNEEYRGSFFNRLFNNSLKVLYINYLIIYLLICYSFLVV